MDRYYNIKLKKKQDFNLGSATSSIRESHAEMRGVFSDLAHAFNGIRSDLLAISDRMNKYRESVDKLTVETHDILGCDVSHIVKELDATGSDIDDEDEYLKRIKKISEIDNPFTRLRKFAELDTLLCDRIDAFESKRDSIRERLKLSDGVQTPENVTAHKMLDKVNFVIGGFEKRRNALTAMRQRLYDNMTKMLEKHKPEIHFN